MTHFDRTDLQRIVTAAVGALVLSTACVVAAVGPVRAASSAPVTVAASTHAAVLPQA